jgi:ribosome-interacting GTPase 1
VRGEYVEIRRQLLRRLEKLQTVQRVKASSPGGSDDPFVIPKWVHLTMPLLGLPNTGKSSLFHRLAGDDVTVADYPFSTTSPTGHHTALDNLRLQVVDLPPLVERTVETLPYGDKLGTLIRNADVLCVVVDLSQDVEHQERTITEMQDSFGVDREAVHFLVLGAKAPAEGLPGEAAATPHLPASARLVPRSEDILPEAAKLMRYQAVFTKPPGQSAEEADRLGGQRGATVKDLARAVRRELADRTKGALV